MPLSAWFFPLEVDMVVVEINGSKSMGPDAFNISFYKRCYGLLKCEVIMMFDQFYMNNVLPKR